MAYAALKPFMKYNVFVSNKQGEGKIIAFLYFSENHCCVHVRRNKKTFVYFHSYTSSRKQTLPSQKVCNLVIKIWKFFTEILFHHMHLCGNVHTLNFTMVE